jgi:hypothetical protein
MKAPLCARLGFCPRSQNAVSPMACKIAPRYASRHGYRTPRYLARGEAESASQNRYFSPMGFARRGTVLPPLRPGVYGSRDQGFSRLATWAAIPSGMSDRRLSLGTDRVDRDGGGTVGKTASCACEQSSAESRIPLGSFRRLRFPARAAGFAVKQVNSCLTKSEQAKPRARTSPVRSCNRPIERPAANARRNGSRAATSGAARRGVRTRPNVASQRAARQRSDRRGINATNSQPAPGEPLSWCSLRNFFAKPATKISRQVAISLSPDCRACGCLLWLAACPIGRSDGVPIARCARCRWQARKSCASRRRPPSQWEVLTILSSRFT